VDCTEQFFAILNSGGSSQNRMRKYRLSVLVIIAVWLMPHICRGDRYVLSRVIPDQILAVAVLETTSFASSDWSSVTDRLVGPHVRCLMSLVELLFLVRSINSHSIPNCSLSIPYWNRNIYYTRLCICPCSSRLSCFINPRWSSCPCS